MSDSPVKFDSPAERHGYGRRWTDIPQDPMIEILAQLPDGIICFDRDWRITYANPAACKISRITPADFNKRTHWDLFPATVGTEVEHNYRAAMEQRVPSHMEYYYAPYDVWLNLRVIPTEDGIAIHYHDITELKNAKNLRDLSVYQLEQISEATNDSIVCIDRNWNCTFANRAAREMFKTDDLIGANLWTKFPLNTTEPFASNYIAAMERGATTEFEAYYPEPLDIWFKVLAKPYNDGIIIFSSDITDRKGAEFLRDASARQLQVVLEVTTDAVVSLDREYNFTFLNRRAKELLAIKGDLVGKNLHEEFPVTRQGAYHYHYSRAMNEGIAGEFEDFYPDPLNIWLSVQARPSDDGIVVFFRDITDRKRNEDALVASEERYRVLTELNPQGIWMSAPDGSITYANQAILDYMGLTMDDLVGTNWISAYYPEDRQKVLDAWSRSVSTGVDYDIEVRLIRARDGFARWWWVRAQAVRADSGKILYWLGVGTDIHDRKTFAETLQQRQEETELQRAQIETIYDTAPIGLALFDPVEFRYLRLNERQVEIVGLPKEEILGRTLTEIAPIEGLREMFQQVAAGNPIRNQLLEGELPSRPGEHRFWNVNYFPVYNVDGTIQAITAASLDITHQKKAEDALIQSEKLAAVGRLASSISHEINNPLEAVTNLLYLISLSEQLPEVVSSYITTAQSELSRVCQIVTQTLRFHRQAVRATNVTAEELVTPVLNLYQGRLTNSNIYVDARYETRSTVLCFENDIRQVLNNLIANAIDAMRQGGRLVIRAHDGTDYTDNRRGVRITIADTGHGMPAAVRARVFEPFYTTKELNGTGLGLWISSEIVKRHQGRLTLRSAEHPIHHGTVFTLFLPYAERSEF